MNLPEILANETLRQHEFPVTRQRIFLAHAAVCPLPRRVADAVRDCAERGTTDDQEALALPGLLNETRAAAARLVGAAPAEIALIGPTSLALSLVAASLPLRKGDNVVIHFDDYPSNVYPWMALEQKGVQVRLLNTRALGAVRTVDVLGQVDENTRLVALASNHFVSGYRPDLGALGPRLRQRGIWFCVDGIQTLGAFPTLAEDADFIAADAHKWLLGPCGAGFLYVRRALIEKLRPPVYGWHNVRCPDFVAQESLEFRPDARRFEAGSHSLIGLAGLKAGIDLLLEVGIEAIGRELLRKRAVLLPALQAKGFTVLNAAAPPEHASGIVTCFRPDTDMAALHQQLAAAGVVASLRTDRQGQRYLRFSPHFYNTDAELERAVAAL